MADDINKKIKIEVELESAKLQKSLTNLNKLIDTLFIKQQQINIGGMQNSAALENVSSKLEIFQKRLKDVNAQVEANASLLNSMGASVKTLDSQLSLSEAQQKKNAAAVGDNTAKISVLANGLKSLDVAVNQQINNTVKNQQVIQTYDQSVVNLTVNVQQLNNSISQTNNSFTGQAETIEKNKVKFDSHKATLDALKSSFDKIKGVSGEFAPSLEEAAKGFEALKSGLDIVKTGFTSVGAAIKTTGFGLLVLVLQSVVDYFTKTSEGGNKLSGVLAAIGKVVEIIHQAFAGLGKIIVDAVSHPVENIKALGKMIWENIVNRFKAFSVILDGIIHLDFKKMANGAIQAFTGITDATDKIAQGVQTIKEGAEHLGKEITDAYQKGTQKAGKAVENHENTVIQSLQRQIAKYKELLAAQKSANNKPAERKPADYESGEDDSGEDGTITANKVNTVSISNTSLTDNRQPVAAQLKNVQDEEDKKGEIKKTALQKVEDYAKQSDVKMATDALKTLNDSIKQQSDAKVAALEKDKAAELSNKSLTSAQKLAIENKYKKQEGAIKAKAFKEEQKLAIAQAIINGAQAVTKVSAQAGILAPFEIGVVIAETAAQVAKIASQKPPAYARGGLHYQSDGRGGVLPGYSRADNTNAYLRSGEGVVVSEAMQVPWARNLVSAINVGFGGRDFSMSNPGKGYAIGGIFTDGGDANRYYNQPVNDQKNLANSIAYQMINNFPPVYVDVKDINNQQNILAQTINRVNL